MITVAMVAALVEETILCMHGGLSPDLKNFEQVNNEVLNVLLILLKVRSNRTATRGTRSWTGM